MEKSDRKAKVQDGAK